MKRNKVCPTKAYLFIVKGHDLELEEVIIPEAVCLSFHGFDFVVGPFQRTG